MAQITDNRPLTPEILTAAGWGKDSNDSFEIINDINYDYGNYRRISLKISDGDCHLKTILRKYANSNEYHIVFKVNRDKVDIISANFRRAITVGEFNQLLDIVGLKKFKI